MKTPKSDSPIKSLVGILEGKVSKLQIDSSYNCRISSATKTNSDTNQVVSYLNKLQQMVPFCPKNRPVSKLKLIQSVIDYIYDLQQVLQESEENFGSPAKNEELCNNSDDSGIEEQEVLEDLSPLTTKSPSSSLEDLRSSPTFIYLNTDLNASSIISS